MRNTIMVMLVSLMLAGCLEKVDPIANVAVDAPVFGDGATGAVTLNWVPPTQNSDGSALSDLAGYTIYIGKSSGSYEQQIQVDNPGITTYMVENMSPGTYYFAATAFNTSGVESTFSGEVVKTVN